MVICEYFLLKPITKTIEKRNIGYGKRGQKRLVER